MKGVGESEIIRLASDNLGTGTAWRPTSDRSAWNEIVKAANVRMSLGITVAPYKWDRQDAYQGWKESINS